MFGLLNSLFGQKRPKTLPRHKQVLTGHDLSNLKPLTDLGVAPPLEVVEQHNLTLHHRQRTQCFEQRGLKERV